MNPKNPPQSTSPAARSSPAMTSVSPDLLLCQTFYGTKDPVVFDRDADTVILVGDTSPGVVEPPQRLLQIRSCHLFLNSSLYKRLFSGRCINNIPRTDDDLRHFKITLSDVDPEALFLILRACHTGKASIRPSTPDILDLVFRIAKTAHDLEFDIGIADPSSDTATLSQAAQGWLSEQRDDLDVDEDNLVVRWKLTKAAFYFSQLDIFMQLSVDLVRRLPEHFWVRLAGDTHPSVNMHQQHQLSREEMAIVAVRLLFLFYHILYSNAPFPPFRAPLPTVSQLPARDAQAQESSVCTCPWLPQYYESWTRGLELHCLDLFTAVFGGDETRCITLLFKTIAWALRRGVIAKPWDSCEAGEEPECGLAGGRQGHEEKARELVKELRSCLDAWKLDIERDPVGDSDVEDFDDEGPDRHPGAERYSGVRYNELEGRRAEYPRPVYSLPLGNFNFEPPDFQDRDIEDFQLP
ncbi:hypothetical protein GE21DRAFT_5320 [Neurospora crassa]|uniref:BTB domain-containing protein n=1 Tax=Neurospora crassa (strain ATCC 24698 / 74-OR23-1A / CBS 708.71 / DSM 1257 / FGSC 987) TaxID=367110 RepID=Q7S368_NEUCR|nr:hypothetical protein NCU04877 [Neurospora crassa OR74A]EAA29898.1 hypothetical protein NCU04877 [Neurospora crassa OR74A]KHE81905.1 hypothetical protein GE21DRAFT_5320 [Neurospora crassa]|eukprot:XP_959134.1 hypothetical protein NCU04877 [Neurospora crassa OR74A]